MRQHFILRIALAIQVARGGLRALAVIAFKLTRAFKRRAGLGGLATFKRLLRNFLLHLFLRLRTVLIAGFGLHLLNGHIALKLLLHSLLQLRQWHLQHLHALNQPRRQAQLL